MSQETDQVIAIERGFWTEANNRRYFEDHVADDGISVIEPMGVIEKKQAVLMTADAPWHDVEMNDLVVRQLTPDLIVLSYHGSGRRSDDEKPHRSSIASTYVRLGGRWQLALTAHQPWTPKKASRRPRL